jgi:pimeloyl-ACP methyl ester carboxylesterase
MKSCFNNLKPYVLVIGFLFSFKLQVYSQSKSNFPDTLSGKLVTIGNHKLFVSEKGTQDAKFTVVFESGAGGTSKDWTKVISMLPPEIRTVAYDRAGAGKSETGPLPQTMAQNVFELHELLKTIKINGPIILVGQSMGGLIVRLYTAKYGNKVIGLVLVDPLHENSMLGSLRYGGWVRLREKATGKPIPIAQVKDSISAGYDSTVDYMAQELQNVYLSDIENPQQLDNRPLIILGAGIREKPRGTPDDQWKKLRSERDKQVQDLTILSGNSKFILDPKSSHQIQYDDPEIVAKAIQLILNSIVAKSRL